MSEDLDLPWPQCLGTFDEESCRFFLYEIGTQLVPRYPFSFGMGEVYGQILEAYGYNATPDVTSLLQELLEDDKSAAGLGDDGDVWRSWRHGWRHRNAARFGPLVLRPSTAPRIRQLKADNFNLQRDTSAKSARNEGEHHLARIETQPALLDDCRMSQAPAQGTDCDKGIVLAAGSARVEGTSHFKARLPWSKRLRSLSTFDKSGSDFRSRRLSTTDARHRTSATLQTLKSDKRGSTQLRGGENITQSIRDSDSVSRTAGSRLDGSHASRGGVVVDPKMYMSGRCSSSAREPDVICTLPVEQDQLRARTRVRDSVAPEWTRTRTGSTSGNSGASESVARVTPSPESSQKQSISTPDHQRRAAHRQARLIDGTIFTSRHRRSKTIGQTHEGDHVSTDQLCKRISGRLSWSPIKYRDSLHSNWTRELRHVFHPGGRHKHMTTSQRHQSVPTAPKLDLPHHLSSMSIIDEQRTFEVPSSPSHPRPITFGLDGAEDRVFDNASSVDLNKPLPLNPDEIVRSISSRSHKSSSQHSEYSSNLLSAASNTSSLSQLSSKKDFRGITRDILQTEMVTPHDLPPIREDDTVRCDTGDPKKSPEAPASPVSYTSVARGNPFHDNKLFRSPTRPPPLDLSKSRADAVSNANQVDSQSEQVPKTTRGSGDYFHSLSWSRSMPNEQSIEMSELKRGRSMRNAESANNTIKENVPPKTPTKRSRSPIKRFLGLTKSNSTNKIEQADVPPLPVTPGSVKKDSLKKWGDRFRYGFLTPDQEQLRQEELIEAHNNDSTNSTPQNSTFPISLEPPVQAKIQSEIELIVTVTANRYLMREAKAGRISAETVAKVKQMWEKMNRPQVVEFHYDQLTQYSLVMTNLDHVKLYGDAAKDAIAINATLRSWKTMAREMAIRTFCSPDSVIRKHLHDAHRVLELLGAPLVTFMAYEDMQIKALAKISQRQKERVDRQTDSGGRNASTFNNTPLAGTHRRNASEGSCIPQQHTDFEYPITALELDKISLSPSPTPVPSIKVRKATGAGGAIASLPSNFERSRDNYAARLREAKTGVTTREI